MEANSWNRGMLEKPDCWGHCWYHENVQSIILTSKCVCNQTDHSKHASSAAIDAPLQHPELLTDCGGNRFHWTSFWFLFLTWTFSFTIYILKQLYWHN